MIASRVKTLAMRLTASRHLLPDFVIIGAMKCGTSSLFGYLQQHPDVVHGPVKEVHYFDDHYDRGETWYRHQFPTVRQTRHRPCVDPSVPPVCGEASPFYLFHNETPKRMSALIPQAKLIVLLRHPADRAYSHYQHQVRKEREDRSFEQAVDDELKHLADPESTPLHADREQAFAERHFQYVKRGFYAEQLERWFASFPRDQFLIMRAEDLFNDPESVYNRTLDFLGLAAFRPDAFRVLNPGSYKSSLEPAMRERLCSVYQPHNDRLDALLDGAVTWDDLRV